MEEEIKFTIFQNLNEANTQNLEGLCFYFAINIKSDLEMLEIPVQIHQIEGYKHFYLLAGLKGEYLIDVTYSQFLPKKKETPLILEDYPARLLQKTKEGKEILENLLKYGYHKLTEGDLETYLSSFKLKERKKTK